MAAPIQPDWAEHSVTIVAVLAGFIVILMGIIIRGAGKAFKDLRTAINDLQATITRIFEKYDDHEHRLSMLEGSHRERTKMKLSCTAERED